MKQNDFEQQLCDEFRGLDVPDMKLDIMGAIREGTHDLPHKKRRISRIMVIAAILLLLTLTVGAVASGILKINSGNKYYFRDADGNLVKPAGLHLEEPIDAPLSDTALANIAPYVFSVGAEATLYETTVLEELETFLDQQFYLPDIVKTSATIYRLWAVGPDVHTAVIYVQIQIDDKCEMEIHLRSDPINIITGSDPKFFDYRLSDGTSAQLASAERTRGGRTVQAFYLYDEVLYQISMIGEKEKILLREVKSMLDTVDTGIQSTEK